MEHFKEYLPYQSFLVRTDINPLTYIMSTPNLDAMDHWWVSALTQFNFELEYQKAWDNTVADVLSWVTTQLGPDMVRSILDGVTLGTVHQTEVHDPTIVEGDHTWNKRYMSSQAMHLYKCMLLIGLKPRKKTQCWAQCWTGWRHRRRQIWRCFWQNMSPVKKTGWSYGIGRILQFIKEPCTCPQHPNVRPKIFYSLWTPGAIVLPPWMGATGVQVIRYVTIPCHCYGRIAGGQVWPSRCSSLSGPAHIACSMRAICPKHPYTWLWPPLWWTSCM